MKQVFEKTLQLYSLIDSRSSAFCLILAEGVTIIHPYFIKKMKTNWQFKHKAITAKAEVQLISTIVTFPLAALKQKL